MMLVQKIDAFQLREEKKRLFYILSYPMGVNGICSKALMKKGKKEKGKLGFFIAFSFARS